jgi:hypothetical protein
MYQERTFLIKFADIQRDSLFIKESQPNTRIKRFVQAYKDILDIQDEKSISVITITKYFQDENVPESVIISTIAHNYATIHMGLIHLSQENTGIHIRGEL